MAIINGTAANDNLLGGTENDSITGGDGSDTLQGGAGNDTIYGSFGEDTYIFNLGNALFHQQIHQLGAVGIHGKDPHLLHLNDCHLLPQSFQ